MRPADQLRQLHQPGHGVHVVWEHPAVRGLLSVRHLFPVWPVYGVADPGMFW